MAEDDRPLLVMRRGSMLVPVAPMDSEALMEMPGGKPMRCRLTMPRNVQRLRLYWSMIDLIAENLDGITRKALHDAVKVRLGFCTAVPFKTGSVVVPDSIAFDAMDEKTFADFLDAFKKMVRTDVIPGLNNAAFERAALEMLGEG